MKRIHFLHTLMFAVVAGTMFSSPLSRVHADDIELRRLLHGPERCDHVIGLLLRHGVNNDTTAGGLNTFHPLGPIAIPAADLGDLELISVARHAETAAGCGPAFDLVIKNCSTRDVCGSRLTLVGLFGRICPTSPNVTIKIDSLPAGQALQVCLTLPIESLAMGNLNGQVIGFNRVLVVIDSFDQFMESNEANNLRVFDAASIPVAVAAVEVIESAVATVGPATVGPATVGPATVGPATVGPAAVTESVTSQPVTSPAFPGPSATSQPVATQPATPPAMPQSPSDLSEPDLQSAINQFTDEATAKQDAS